MSARDPSPYDEAEGQVTGELPRASATSQLPRVSDTPPEFPARSDAALPSSQSFLWEGRWWSRTPQGLFWYDGATERWIAYAPPAYLPEAPSARSDRYPPATRSAVGPAPARRRPRISAVIGGVLVVVGALLPWVSSAAGSSNSFDVPVDGLLSADFDAGGTPVGVALVVLGALAALLAFVPFMGLVRALCGLLVVAAVAAFAGQLARILGPQGLDALVDVLAPGVYVTALGGTVLTVGR